MERGMINGGCQIESNNLYDGITCNKSDELKITTGTSGSSTSSPSSSFLSSSSSSPSNNFKHIRHEVCRMDTLAGIAIKYGVEISDVRRLNGLVTDLHMFAHKTLRIPFEGRHRTCYHGKGHIVTLAHAEHRGEIIGGFDTHNPKVLHHPKTCPAIEPPHGHYGPPPIAKRKVAQHKTDRSFCLRHEDLLLDNKPAPKQHRRSRSLQTVEITEVNGDPKRSTRQCQRVNASPEGSSGTGTYQ